MRLPAWTRLLAVGVVLLVVAAWLRRTEPRNVLVLLVDTLRADHLSLYGYPRPTSPTLDALARDAVVFERARSQAPCTFPSVNSLLTSRYPGHFVGQGFANFAIPEGMPTAAELLKAHGIATFAASASRIVRATPSKTNPKGGFGRGFDTFDETCVDKAAQCINQRFFDFLGRTWRPFFAYLHYMEPHHPYAPPTTFNPRFADPTATGPTWALMGNPDPIEKALAAGRPAPGTPADLQMLVDHYDDEIAYWDTQLGALFAELDRRGLRRNTMIVLAADHGEMFLEHGDIKHCRKLFDTVTHTPLVVWLAGTGGRHVETPVQNVDVLPTILDVLGVETPGWTPHGHSLKALLHGQPMERRLAYSALDKLSSVNDARFKLIRDTQYGTTQLFDLTADPGEHADVASSYPEERERLDGALAAWLAEHDRANARSGGAAGRDVQDALRALGYME
jgi:arylsulfatase A-like enzyme